MFADDVDEVLADLDYKQANLVGISYGATAEQVFLARHPDRVRTMTLLSGTLLDVPVLERFPESAQRALDNVFAECERDAACQQAFPQLRADWDALWRSVNAAPWVVPADRSPTGTEVVFDANWVASGLHDLLFVATTHARIPLLVHTLGAADDKVGAILAIAQAYPDTSGTGSGDEQMLGYLIRCNEAWARFDPGQLVGTDSFEYEQDRNDAEWWQSVCAFIPEAGDTAAATPPSVGRAGPRPQRRGGPAGPAGQHGGRRSRLAEQPRPDRARARSRHRPRIGAVRDPAHPVVHRPGHRDRPRHHLPVAAPAARVRPHAPE